MLQSQQHLWSPHAAGFPLLFGVEQLQHVKSWMHVLGSCGLDIMVTSSCAIMGMVDLELTVDAPLFGLLRSLALQALLTAPFSVQLLQVLEAATRLPFQAGFQGITRTYTAVVFLDTLARYRPQASQPVPVRRTVETSGGPAAGQAAAQQAQDLWSAMAQFVRQQADVLSEGGADTELGASLTRVLDLLDERNGQ